MKYGIIYKPTNEYVAFNKDNKEILFTEDEDTINEAINDLVLADGGYDNDYEDFQITLVDTDTDGSDLIKKDCIFVASSLIDNKKEVKEEIEYFAKDEETGMSCGINSDGQLFIGDDKSGGNMDDTPDNRLALIRYWKKYTGKDLQI